jgi:undecaprenyl-diphosphatase
MDQKLLFLINRQWTGPVLDYVMALLSSFDAWIPLMILLIAILFWRGGFHARAFILCAGLIVGINDGVISNSLKHLVGRPRPHQSIDGVRQVDLAKTTPRIMALAKPLKIKLSEAATDLSEISGRSFPSSHTINTTTVALLAALFFRGFSWLAFLPSLGVAYSRIYTGSHWPSDVFASIFLGLGTTLLLFGCVEWLWRKYGARFAPVLRERHPSLLTP